MDDQYERSTLRRFSHVERKNEEGLNCKTSIGRRRLREMGGGGRTEKL